MGFSHFHGICDKHICTLSNRYCEVIWFQLLIFFIYLILIYLLPTNHHFGRWKQHLFDILFFANFKKCILKNLVELPIKTTFDLKFSRSTGDELNLAYDKKE